MANCNSLHISEMGIENSITSTEEDAESLMWNDMIAPLLKHLENVAAGSVSNTTMTNSEKGQT